MHLGMKLHRPHFPLGIFDGGDRIRSFRREPETVWQLFGLVAMRHPNREFAGQSLKKFRVGVLNFNLSVAVLALSGGANFAAERVDHELQSVADTEHGDAEIEDALIRERSVFVVHRRRAARENDSYWRVAANFFQAGIEGKYDREDFLFADAAGDELRILRAEVEDYD